MAWKENAITVNLLEKNKEQEIESTEHAPSAVWFPKSMHREANALGQDHSDAVMG